jgi:threonylcarbamoyladenosine tRNA methylthiotransferase MtaB
MMLLDQARQIDDNFAITTDVIAGFPGETLAEFEESLDFIQKAAFSGGHVFPYSARRSPCSQFPGPGSIKERKIRAARVRDVLG